MKIAFALTPLLWLMICAQSSLAQPPNGWTIMHYAVGSNSSETDLLSDIGEMIRGKTSEGYEVITLIDRVEGYSEDATTLGENFTDTRLYQLDANTYEELDGGDILPEIDVHSLYEANMGDADLLKRFIQYCKTHYPANHYMLVLRSHGNGNSMCPDAEAGPADHLFPGELRDVLTQAESVDILGLDVCSMAGMENLYEWRPSLDVFSADYVLASAPLSGAWAYDEILGRLQESEKGLSQGSNHFGGGPEKDLNPYEMTPHQFAELILEEIYDNQHWTSWGLFDNAAIEAAKKEMDELAKLLVQVEKATIMEIVKHTLDYSHDTDLSQEVSQLAFPYIDAYDFCQKVSQHQDIKEACHSQAKAAAAAIDKVVIQSFYGQGFLPPAPDFEEGKQGLYLIFPFGDKVFSQSGRTFWSHTAWFHPDAKADIPNAYGLYDWCSDGAISGNGQVDNFFEYLDFLFDKKNDADGGGNGYRW